MVCDLVWSDGLLFKMLAKPPTFLQEVISQESEQYSAKSRDRSKSRGKRKETSLRIGQPPPPSAPPLPNIVDHDNDSVHSAASRRSRDKKTKESSLSRPKILGNRDEDSQSQHSHASSRSRNHSKKKENSLTSRPKPAETKKIESEIIDDPPLPNRFSDVLEEPQESVIKLYELEEVAPGYRESKKKVQPKNPTQSKPKFSPFENFSHPSSQKDNAVSTRTTQKRGGREKQAAADRAPEPVSSAVPLQKHPIVEGQVKTGEVSCRGNQIEESLLKETKSRRRSIFGAKNEEVSNTSKLTHTISNSEVYSIEDSSRRKSKSRLRQIFDKSKEKSKKEEMHSPVLNRNLPQRREQPQMVNTQLNQTRQETSEKGNASSVGWSSQLQSRAKPQVRNNMVQLQLKAPDDDNFMAESSKSALDLTVSQHAPPHDKERDSFVFEFEPQKKKGVTVTSKLRHVNDPQQQDLPVTADPLVSGVISKGVKLPLQRHLLPDPPVSASQRSTLPITTEPLTSGVIKKDSTSGNNVSKELDDMEKLLKQNDEYFKASGVLNLSASGEAKPDKSHTGSGYLFQFDDEEINQRNAVIGVSSPYQNEQPWHQIVPQHQQHATTIKQVERNQPSNKSEKGKKQIEDQQTKRTLRQREEKNRKEEQKQEEEKRREREREEMERQEFKRRQQEQFDRIKKQKEQQRRIQRKREEEEEQTRIKEEELKEKEFERKTRNRQEREEVQSQNRFKQRQNAVTSAEIAPARDLSEKSSDRSHRSSNKKGGKKESSISRTKKEGCLPMGKRQIYVEPQAPRADESYYEESEREKGKDSTIFKGLEEIEKSRGEKKPKLKKFSDDQGEFEVKPKSKTDMNFYQLQSMKSKPPSSRPPLSRKSNASNSKSHQKRPKQNSLGKKKHTPYQPQQQAVPAKKMTLMERAMKNDSSDYSQDSYRSRDDFSSRSRDSLCSRGSRKSGGKKENTIAIKLNKHMPMIQSKYSRPERAGSFDSSEEGMTDESRHEVAQRQQDRNREQERRVKQQLNQRVVVSKNCMFIDQKGRLVQKDLVIRGKEVYGKPSDIDNSSVEAVDRMRRSRQQRRSRSRERGQNGSRLSRQTSGEMTDSQFSSSNTFYQNNSRPSNQSYYRQGQEEWGNNQSLREFMKPVQEVPNYHQPYEEQSYKGTSQTPPVTLNDMFRRRGEVEQSQVSMQSSRSRRSLHRTERSRNKR